MARSFLLALAALLATASIVLAQNVAPPRRVAVLAEIDGVIGPAAAHLVEGAIAQAEKRGAEILILQIDTPGGLATSMRDIMQHILASRVPVVGYVAPAGGHAASAGVFILYATHVAAMAPGTNVGAATPVSIGGAPPADEEPAAKGKQKQPPSGGDALTRKATNDAVASLRSLAQMRGRNADWAEAAVREAAALPAREALRLRVIEIVAEDVEELLEKLDGRSVSVAGETRTLATRNLAVERFEPTFITQALAVLSDPNIALLLVLIGFYGLIFEFSNPGSVAPGIIGAIALVLGLYALNQLPLNYAGLALIVLGVGLMTAEAFTPTFGVFGVGGLIAFIIGAAMLIDTDLPAFRLSWTMIASAAALSAIFLIIILGAVMRAFRRPIATGMEHLMHEKAEVIDWAAGEGHVWTQGERWSAAGDYYLAPGQVVDVVGVEALRLRVKATHTGGAA